MKENKLPPDPVTRQGSDMRLPVNPGPDCHGQARRGVAADLRCRRRWAVRGTVPPVLKATQFKKETERALSRETLH